ncbi:MAG: response regulator [Verrucomicrobiota bacterium]
MKILAIDDNQDNLSELRAVVTDRLPGVRIFTSLNGPQGLEVAQAETPDVILLDIVMPGMDGYAVCRKLKADENLCMIPVLFLIAHKTDRDSRVKALEAGAEGFISKPFDVLELSAQIQAMAKIKAATLNQRNDKERLAGLVAERTRALQQSQHAMLNLLEDLQEENKARHASELAQRESEQRYHQLFESASDALLLIASDTNRIIEANRMATELYGYDAQELLRHCSTDLAADPEEMLHLSQEVQTPSDQVLHIPMCLHRKKDQTIFPAEITARSFSLKGQLLLLLAVRDITERKLAAEALARQLDELRRWQTVTLGREDRIAELKREINALATRLGQPPPYATPDSI